jgi:hypothetical protein
MYIRVVSYKGMDWTKPIHADTVARLCEHDADTVPRLCEHVNISRPLKAMEFLEHLTEYELI